MTEVYAMLRLCFVHTALIVCHSSKHKIDGSVFHFTWIVSDHCCTSRQLKRILCPIPEPHLHVPAYFQNLSVTWIAAFLPLYEPFVGCALMPG